MPRRSLIVFVLAAVVVVAVGAVVAAGWRAVRARELPTGGAEWVWAELPERLPSPVAFYAVRDFSLAGVAGAWEAGDAGLRMLADEEYVVWVNGRRVGSNRYAVGAPVDVYEVGDLLLPGMNRLAVELRSSRGAGGLLAAVVATEDERVLVASDESWRIVREWTAGLVEGWVPVPGEERATSWGRPPTGRWGWPELGAVRPRLAAVGEPCGAVPAAAVRRAAADGPGRVTFDWGREVVGYLRVRHPEQEPAAGPSVSLFAVGEKAVRPLSAGAHALPLVGMPGSVEWTDVVPRRFRYAAVVGMPGPLEASVVPVEAAALAALPGCVHSEATDPGVLGLAPRPRRLPAEDTVRRRLQKAADEPE